MPGRFRKVHRRGAEPAVGHYEPEPQSGQQKHEKPLRHMSPHCEFKFYSFAVHAGLSNLFSNGMSLGAKKTIGKIVQPINSYSRFPEYYWFEKAICDYWSTTPSSAATRILDVGSPKMLGLYLGYKTDASVMLTDISDLNVGEYRTMWSGLERRAKGKVSFSLQDARDLQFRDNEFDIVYSMSVIEHIEGAMSDSRAVLEMQRVLKPGGLLILSVPLGDRFVEQVRVGVSGAVRKTGDQKAYFFQRVYDPQEFQRRILAHLADLKEVALTKVSREHQWVARGFGSLGENVRGALGFMNPLLSVVINRSSKGMDGVLRGSYGQFHRASDVYGDLILTGRK